MLTSASCVCRIHGVEGSWGWGESPGPGHHHAVVAWQSLNFLEVTHLHLFFTSRSLWDMVYSASPAAF